MPSDSTVESGRSSSVVQGSQSQHVATEEMDLAMKSTCHGECNVCDGGANAPLCVRGITNMEPNLRLLSDKLDGRAAVLECTSGAHQLNFSNAPALSQ